MNTLRYLTPNRLLSLIFGPCGPLEWAKVSVIVRETYWDNGASPIINCPFEKDWLQRVTGLFVIGAIWPNKCSPSDYITPTFTVESIKENLVDLCYSCQYLTLPSTCQNIGRFFFLRRWLFLFFFLFIHTGSGTLAHTIASAFCLDNVCNDSYLMCSRLDRLSFLRTIFIRNWFT